MTTLVRTTNSAYEIDEVEQQVRRIGGMSLPTKRFKADGVWVPYLSISHEDGYLTIEWPDGESPTHTVTSQIHVMEQLPPGPEMTIENLVLRRRRTSPSEDDWSAGLTYND